MITRGVIGIALLISLFILAGCATNSLNLAERAEAYDAYIVEKKLEKLDRITTFRFDGWADLGEQHLIISTNVNRMYLLTFKNKCFDLHHSQAIKINQTGSVLQTKFDSIEVVDDFPMRCFIDGIYKISREQRRELIAIGRDKESTEEDVAKAETAD
ncbi:MAG: hypothetical protein HKP09_02145 [Enterobacterales bacterium]|nr:hypothetical protein [Enterobacterales bacterium]